MIGSSEVEERSSYGREVLDEATVEVNEAYEGLHVSPALWGGPLVDSSNFNRVYCNLVLQDDQPEVFNLLLVELTLLQTVSRTESRGTEVKDNREKLHSVPE